MLALILTLAAGLTAALSAMAGLGGGTILIAVLYAVGLTPVAAVPLHAGVQLAANFSRTLAYLKFVNWGAIKTFLLGAASAPFLLAPLVAMTNVDAVRLFMAAFIVLAMWPGWLKCLRLGGRTGLVTAGVIAGGVGMVTGATGPLIAPFFLRDEWAKETVIATMAVCQSLAYVLKIVAFSAWGFHIQEQWELLLPMVIAAIVGTLIGRQLMSLFTEASFRWVFRAILTVLALKLAADGLSGLFPGLF